MFRKEILFAKKYFLQKKLFAKDFFLKIAFSGAGRRAATNHPPLPNNVHQIGGVAFGILRVARISRNFCHDVGAIFAYHIFIFLRQIPPKIKFGHATMPRHRRSATAVRALAFPHAGWKVHEPGKPSKRGTGPTQLRLTFPPGQLCPHPEMS